MSANETGRDVRARAELKNYASRNYVLYAPGAIVSETLYVLCLKMHSGILSAPEYSQAVIDFERIMKDVLPPPNGDSALIARASAIGSGYGCSRSADSIYIALAEELTTIRPTVLLTFDSDLPNQAARNAPTVTVHLLT